MLIGEGDFDFADRILNVVTAGGSVAILDNVTEGLLLERLKARYGKLASGLDHPPPLLTNLMYQCGGTRASARATIVCELGPMVGSQSDILFTLRIDEIEIKKEVKLPGLAQAGASKEGFTERSRRWAAELALRFWSENV